MKWTAKGPALAILAEHLNFIATRAAGTWSGLPPPLFTVG